METSVLDLMIAIETLLRLPLVVQWLRPHTLNAGAMDSIPGWGTKILHASQCGQKLKKKKRALLKKFKMYLLY